MYDPKKPWRPEMKRNSVPIDVEESSEYDDIYCNTTEAYKKGREYLGELSIKNNAAGSYNVIQIEEQIMNNKYNEFDRLNAVTQKAKTI